MKSSSRSEELGMAVGIDIGTTFVSKLGTHGHRDRICISDAVEKLLGTRRRARGRDRHSPRISIPN